MVDSEDLLLNKRINTISLQEDDSSLNFNIESTDFVKIESRDGDLGRIVVATRDVVVGTKIIREKPILVFTSENWSDMVSKFVALDEKSKNGVLNMFHPPFTSHSVLSHNLKAEADHLALHLSLDPVLVLKLMAICNCNAHEYYGFDHERYNEVESNSRVPSKESALFLFGSKVAHSCNPNVTYSSRTCDGKLEYRVIRPIQANDMVTFSYIGDVFDTPTHIRRNELKDTKNFLCRCPRCMGPDFSRLVSCEKCKNGVVVCTDPEGTTPAWSCSDCGDLDSRETERIHILENEMERNINAWDQKMKINLADCIPSIFKNQVVRSLTKLHPRHYHTLRLTNMYIRLCVSQAVQMDNISKTELPRHIVVSIFRKIGTPIELRSEAAKMGITLIEKFECIAADCTVPESAGRCTVDHVPIQGACQLAFHTAHDMMKCPSSKWPHTGRNTIQRYIPAMRRQYGDNDEDVAAIERNIFVPKEQGKGGNTSSIEQKSAPNPIRESVSKKQNKKKGRVNNKKKKKGNKNY